MRTACVIGGSGYIASALIKLLLEKGYTVNATVRDPDDTEKNSHLREMQGLGGSLKIIQADLTQQGSFDEAVSGCDFIFLVAAPTSIFAQDPEKELIEPAVQGTLNVLRSCVKAGSVKTVVLTSSTVAVSIVGPLEGTDNVLDEDSWSDPNYLRAEKPLIWGYAVAKVLAEKEAVRFTQANNIRLITVNPTTTIGSAPAPELKISMAHLFLAENSSASGRYICGMVNTNLNDLAGFLAKRYPQYNVNTDFGDFPQKAKVKLSNKKLMDAGFKFKYTCLEEMYDDAIEYAKARRLLQ